MNTTIQSITKSTVNYLAAIALVCGHEVLAQSNIVSNGSFEAGPGGWGFDGPLNVAYPDYQAFDGIVWVSPEVSIWQDLITDPGRDYYVKFATKNLTSLTVRWGETNATIVNVSNPNISANAWDVASVSVTANSNLTRLRFEVNSAPFKLDAVEVRWLQEPVQFVVPVPSRSAFEGGSVTFPVTAIGAPPLSYQWFHDGDPIPNATNRTLVLTNLLVASSGDYWVQVTNNYNANTSLKAKLIVNPMPESPLIVAQPKPRTVVQGYAASMYVVAFGASPLFYQWHKDGTSIPGETNSALQFPSVSGTNDGSYSVMVSNHLGTVTSVSAPLQSSPPGSGGGMFSVANRLAGTIDSPIFDTDGVTRLAGSNYVAQLFAGISPNSLNPVGAVHPFRTGTSTGYFYLGTRTIPDVPFGNTAYCQIRAWDYSVGKSYEESRARGGRHGKMKITEQIAYDPMIVPPQVIQFKSFSLEAGASPLATARFELGAQQPGGDLEWMLIGDAGYNYVVESQTPPNDWSPILVLTNATGVVSFVDTNGMNSSPKFYRARIIEP